MKKFHRLLPNADELDAESKAAWQNIKTGLGTAFAVGEVRPAGAIWINEWVITQPSQLQGCARYMKFGLAIQIQDTGSVSIEPRNVSLV